MCALSSCDTFSSFICFLFLYLRLFFIWSFCFSFPLLCVSFGVYYSLSFLLLCSCPFIFMLVFFSALVSRPFFPTCLFCLFQSFFLSFFLLRLLLIQCSNFGTSFFPPHLSHQLSLLFLYLHLLST